MRLVQVIKQRLHSCEYMKRSKAQGIMHTLAGSRCFGVSMEDANVSGAMADD